MPPRSTNRRNAPQSPPKPVAELAKSTRRSGRAQSHESTGDALTVQPAARGTKRGQQPDKTALANIAESATGQLSTYEQDEGSVAGQSDAGQTAYTQFQLESKFNRAEMIAALADLQDDANAFMALATAADEAAVALLHADPDEDLPPAARRFRGRFRGLLDAFQSSLQPYKDDSDTFINVQPAVATLADASNYEEVNEQDRSPEALFQLANVTELLSMTLHGRATASLESINTGFPTPFFTEFATSWGNALSDKTVELALGIRTQYFLDLLEKRMGQPDFDPDYLLRSVFFDDAGGLLALQLTEDDGSGMHQSCKPLFEKRVQDIRQHFSQGEPSVDLPGLEATYPWAEFRAELVQWTVFRANGLNIQISNRGGAKALQMHLQGGPQLVSISEKKRKSVGDKARQVKEMLAQVQANHMRRETLNAQRNVLGEAQVSEIQESPVHAIVAYDEPTANDGGMDDRNILASQQSMQVLETLRLHLVQSNKENVNKETVEPGRKGKFTDRQPGATRVELIDDTPLPYVKAGPSRKRAHEVVESADVEDDDESIHFEEDSRPGGGANKRARSHLADDDLVEAAAQFAANAQLLSLSHNGGAGGSQPLPTRQAATPSRQSRDQLPPASTAPADFRPAPLSPAEDIPGSQAPPPPPMAGALAKGPQVRVPFSVEESARLIDLIAGLPEDSTRISWAQLEKEDLRHPDGPLLQKRGQVGLKDKARNLKMDFLKARQAAPRNFGLIPLGNRLIDQLDKLGVPHSER